MDNVRTGKKNVIWLIFSLICCSILTLEQGKTTTDAMGDVWRGLEVVEAATRVGTDMLVRRRIIDIFCICYEYSTNFISL